ncbi:MAG: HVO_A0114 family putative DNA-binding protein [Acidithiobacillus ferrivorans]
MEMRTLTITVQPDWKAALRAAGKAAQAETYQGETLNFESPDVFLGRLTALRWSLVRQIMSAGEISIRELARRVGRDVRRVHDDVLVLAELGLIERTTSGGVSCPFADIHVDMHLRKAG